MKEQIVSLLASGIGTVQVAEAIGCDPSYVSQIAGEHREQIGTLKAERFSEFIARDKMLEQAEDLVLNKTVQLIPFITRPSEAARVYGILNTAKRKTGDAAGQQTNPGTTVVINLPAAAAIQFTVTADKQVIELEGRSMVTLPAKNVEQRLQERSAQRLLNQRVPASLVSKL